MVSPKKWKSISTGLIRDNQQKRVIMIRMRTIKSLMSIFSNGSGLKLLQFGLAGNTVLGHGPCLQSFQTDRSSAFLADPIASILDPIQSLIDLLKAHSFILIQAEEDLLIINVGCLIPDILNAVLANFFG
jgi:hypothetical protein